MSTTLAEALSSPPLAQLPIPPLAIIWPDLTAVCLFSLLGVIGDPLDEATDIGTIINTSSS